MEDILYDPWLVAVVSQIIGGVSAGLIVNQLTKNRSSISDKDIERLFNGNVKVPRSITFRFLLNWRYLIFYLILLAGIAGITLLQDPSSISWFTIIFYVIVVTWWSMVALNVFVLMDGAVLEGRLPNPILLFISIIVPIVGHTKSVIYTLFAFITKIGLGIFLFGFFSRFFGWKSLDIIFVLLISFALVDTSFYAYLFLPKYPEFYNWRSGHFIISHSLFK